MPGERRAAQARCDPATDADAAELLGRCGFPAPGTPVRCACSGGPDSTALVALAVAAGCRVTAVHVRHGLRDDEPDVSAVRGAADALGVDLDVHRLSVEDGPNLEARARRARRAVVGADTLTGHTADDAAETVLLALMRGAGARGLGSIPPGPSHPLLALRRRETRALCDRLGLPYVDDPTNESPRFRRNRVRHELLPLLDDVAGKDVVPTLVRAARLLRADDELLDELAGELDPTDARALAVAPLPLARRAVRRWLRDPRGTGTTGGDDLPPDAATVGRVLDVAAGRALACEVGGGRRVERSRQRLRVTWGSDMSRRTDTGRRS